MCEITIITIGDEVMYLGDDFSIENVEFDDGTVAQICVMGESCRLCFDDNYEAPTYPLSYFAPNDEMKSKWDEVDEFHEKHRGFKYNGIFMMQMKCGHYEVFQHPARNLTELKEWVKLMHTEKHYHKCTLCICGD